MTFWQAKLRQEDQPAGLTFVSPTILLSASHGTAGIAADRMQRISGYADRKPMTQDPTALRNNRIEIVLLRRRLVSLSGNRLSK